MAEMADMDTATTTSFSKTNGHAPESVSLNSSPPHSLRRENRKIDKTTPKKYKHTFAVHAQTRTSCLSHESDAAPSFLGFRNLMGLVLVFSNLRLMIENFKKYGILVTLSGVEIRSEDWRWFGVLYVLTPCFLLIAYIIEVLASRAAKEVIARGKKSEDDEDEARFKEQRKKIFIKWRFIAFAHGLNATIMLVFSTFAVYHEIHNPALGTISELHAVIVWLKVCSYAFTNRDLRHAMLSRNPATALSLPDLYKTCPYPNNITIRNLCYFWWAPTLVYQPAYPRTSHIRWLFVFKRLAEVLLLCVVIWIASAQYAVPLLSNSLDAISTLNLVGIIERTLKLSTISLVCWLAGFFALFQSFLNALAEIMRFGDREFYVSAKTEWLMTRCDLKCGTFADNCGRQGDWWNSSNVRSYWTSWNKPVTHFMKRHIYAPMVGRGLNSTLAQIITFLFSGVLHELLVGVPTHNILGVAFAGMVLQLPLIFLTDPFLKMKGQNWKLLGNLIFWLSFCIFGQPVAALAYFFAWQAKYGDTKPVWPSAAVFAET